MTQYTKDAILTKWDAMSQPDSTGAWIERPAREIADLFREMFEHDGVAHDFTADSRIAAFLRGYTVVGDWAEGVKLYICLDLHSVVMTEDAMVDFDRWLMARTPYHGDMFTFEQHYMSLLYEQDRNRKARKTRRTRKTT